MAKETGLGWTTLDVDDEAGSAQDIRDAVNSLEFATPRGVLEVTGIGKSAFERLLSLADFSITVNFTFDDATSDSPHDVFKTVPSTSVARTVSLVVSGQTLNNETLFTDYALNRGTDGSFTGSAPGVLTGGTVPTWS